MTNAYSISVWKPGGEYEHSEDVGMEGRILSKWSLKKYREVI
jgi:hypothetical protein